MKFPIELMSRIQRHYKARITSSKFLRGGNRGLVYILDMEAHTGQRFSICLKEDTNTERSRTEQHLSGIAYNHAGVALSNVSHGYYTMPYFPGDTLTQLASKMRGMSAIQRANIMLAVAKQINSIHAKGIIHRDIKSDNIIFQKGNKCKTKIVDFGRAVRADAPLEEKSLNKEVGILRRLYRKIRLFFERKAAPEYYEDNRAKIHFQADYFAYGNLFETWLPEFPHLKEGLKKKNPEERLTSRQVATFLEKFIAIDRRLSGINTSKSPAVDILTLFIDHNYLHKIGDKQPALRFLFKHYEIFKLQLGEQQCKAIWSLLEQNLVIKNSNRLTLQDNLDEQPSASKGLFLKPTSSTIKLVEDVVIRAYPAM